jgi:hypothetical protein
VRSVEARWEDSRTFRDAVNEVRGPTRRAPFTIRRDGDFMSADAETRPEERHLSLLLSLREWTNSSTRPTRCSADRRRGNGERVLEHYSRDGPWGKRNTQGVAPIGATP